MLSKKPNVLWIFSDQHRADALSCYGDTNVNTYNIDKLAKEGIMFTNAFSNTPLCSPFRASLYTGKYMTSHGVISLFMPPNQGQRMLAQELKDNGYYTSHAGKWHLSGGDCPSHFVSPYFRPGWDEWLGWENSNRPWNTEYSTGVNPFPIKKLNGYQTDAITDITVDWIKNYSLEKPWFYVLSLETPHPPNTPPEEYLSRFRDKDIKLRDNVPLSSPKIEKYIDTLKRYYAQIENLDFNIGRIISTLEESNQLDDTIIFYFSDHGDMMGSHDRVQKSRPEFESSKIPLIIRYPKLIHANTVSDTLISCVDIMPSLLGLLGQDIPNYVQGKDLSNVIVGKDNNARESILLQFERNFYGVIDPALPYRSIVTKQWMYTLFLEDDKSQLFDLTNDTYQMNNLIKNHEYDDIKNIMIRKLQISLDNIDDDFMQRKADIDNE